MWLLKKELLLFVNKRSDFSYPCHLQMIKKILSNRNISGPVSSSVGWQAHLLRPKIVLRQNFTDCLEDIHICSEDIQGTALTKLDGVETSTKFWCHSTFPPTRARRARCPCLCSAFLSLFWIQWDRDSQCPPGSATWEDSLALLLDRLYLAEPGYQPSSWRRKIAPETCWRHTC